MDLRAPCVRRGLVGSLLVYDWAFDTPGLGILHLSNNTKWLDAMETNMTGGPVIA